MQQPSDHDNPYRAPQPVPAELVEDTNWSPPEIDLSRAILMQGTLTGDDWRRAAALHAAGAGTRLRWLLLLMLFVAIGFFLVRGGPLATVDSAILLVAAFLLIIAGLFLLRRLWRSGWDHAQPEPLRRQVTDAAIRTDTPNSTTTVEWSVFSKYKRSEAMVILYADPPVMYYAFPRSHCASDDDWFVFVAIVESKLKAG